MYSIIHQNINAIIAQTESGHVQEYDWIGPTL